MLLSIRSLGVSIAGRIVLRDVDLDVARGEIVAVVGPNGAGKSTLLSALVGVLPHAGTVAIDGRVRAGFDERVGAMTYVPDAMTMPDETTLGRALGVAREGIWAKRLEVLSLTERVASTVSRGELERAMLAAALDLDRSIVLLDEPFGGLDPRQLRDVIPLVREACRARAALITVHQLAVAERVADRVALLAGGTVRACGTPMELRERAGVGASASLEDAFLALLEERADGAAAPA